MAKLGWKNDKSKTPLSTFVTLDWSCHSLITLMTQCNTSSLVNHFNDTIQHIYLPTRSHLDRLTSIQTPSASSMTSSQWKYEADDLYTPLTNKHNWKSKDKKRHKNQFKYQNLGFLSLHILIKVLINLSDLNRLCYEKRNQFNVQIIFITETNQSFEWCKCDEVYYIEVRQNHWHPKGFCTWRRNILIAEHWLRK